MYLKESQMRNSLFHFISVDNNILTSLLHYSDVPLTLHCLSLSLCLNPFISNCQAAFVMS